MEKKPEPERLIPKYGATVWLVNSMGFYMKLILVHIVVIQVSYKYLEYHFKLKGGMGVF